MTYPPQGPYGQQPPDPYQQGPYQQQPPWAMGPQGGFPMGPPPKKPRTGLIATLIIVAIIAVGGGGMGIYLWLKKENEKDRGGGGGGTAREAAQTYVEELETVLNAGPQKADLAPLEPVTCGEDYSKMSDQVEDAKDNAGTEGNTPSEIEFGLEMKGFEETSDGATFTLAVQLSGLGPGEDSDDKKMTVAKEDGSWKVCGIFEGVGGGGPPTEDGPSQAPSGEVPPNPFPSR